MSEQSQSAHQALDFATFAVVWNQMQKMSTPQVHLRICRWLEGAYVNGERELLLMAFRACGKSTLVALFAAWLLYRDPALRILVLAADSELAIKMVRNVRGIIERHPLTKALVPQKPEQWASDRFAVNRPHVMRDPSMLAVGVEGNITGLRADVIIYDDIEVPGTSATPAKREALRDFIVESSFVLDRSGAQLFVGTPHHYHSIYAGEARSELGEVQSFLHGFKRLEIPVLDEAGKSAWPERFPPEEIEKLRRAAGPNKFASQMMLRPANIANGRLNPALLNIYEGEVDYAPEYHTLYINGEQMAGVSAWWDPAFGSATHNRGDASVLAIIYGDMKGNFYLQHLEYLKADPCSAEPEADQQCRAVALLAKRYRLPFMIVEANGIGRFLPSILKKEMRALRQSCVVKDEYSHVAKATRILEGFDAVMAAGRLYVNRKVLDTPFLSEMQEWRPNIAGGHDDGLDAVAGALSMMPDRLPPGKALPRGSFQSWMLHAGRPYKANSDFPVG